MNQRVTISEYEADDSLSSDESFNHDPESAADDSALLRSSGGQPTAVDLHDAFPHGRLVPSDNFFQKLEDSLDEGEEIEQVSLAEVELLLGDGDTDFSTEDSLDYVGGDC